MASMWRIVLIYGAALAAAALALKLIEFQLLARTHPAELYVGLIAAGFMALGVWVGVRLLPRRPPEGEFTINNRALESLAISGRELEVLEQLAAGRSNKEIASQLGVSPNTVKTHVARLFEKLEVRRRTEAIQRARELGVLR
jgi:DNA-binding CsgD family transcriptional regulator